MRYLQIEGGHRLAGKIEILGAKNSALPVLYATVLTRSVSVISNVPDISDVLTTLEILKRMGVIITKIAENTYEIDTRNVDFCEAPHRLVNSMRGSYYLLGAELGRFGRAKLGEVGGCDFGERPIDQHIKVFRALGATVNQTDSCIVMCADRLVGNRITFDVVSVGATVNAILCAVLAEGRTVLCNCAREPHVVDLCKYLLRCGAEISGAGTSKIIIDGVRSLSGSDFSLSPDMIEAGTYMALGSAIGECIEIGGIEPSHLFCIYKTLVGAGANIRMLDDKILVKGGSLHSVSVETAPYPGFPTDMQPQLVAALTVADGVSHISERVFKTRFRYVEQLSRLGASVEVIGDTVTVYPSRLHGATVETTDLRAGAALVIGALCAEGVSYVKNSDLIKRGYGDMCKKLVGIGAHVSEHEAVSGDGVFP